MDGKHDLTHQTAMTLINQESNSDLDCAIESGYFGELNSQRQQSHQAVSSVPIDTLAAPRKAIVLREIEIQKAKVREKFALLKALEDDENSRKFQSHREKGLPSKKRYAELDNLRVALESSTNINESIFPDWLARREDFQCVFPRFSSKPIEIEDLVLFGMEKEVKTRTGMDIDTAVRFLQKFDSFRDMSPDFCRNLTKIMHVSRHRPGEILFKQNEAANMVYFVLRGIVELRMRDAARSQNSIVQLQRGECCGTEALSHDLDRRNKADACCVSDDEGKVTEIVVLALSGQDLRSTTKVYLQSQHARLSRFLQTQVPLFRGWSKHRVNQVAPLLTERRFRPGDIVQHTGDLAADLYFVYEGACDAEREVSRTQTNRWPKSLLRVESACTLEHEQRETRMVKSVKLAELGPGAYFGEEFLIGYVKKRTTVTATKMTTLLCLPKEQSAELFSTRMIQDIRQRHDALFTSDEEILAEHERAQRLEGDYERLKRAAFGPAYLQRSRKSHNKGKNLRKTIRVTKSLPLLSNNPYPHPQRRVGSQSSANLLPEI